MTSITGSDFTNMGTVWKLISRLPGMYQEWWLNLYHESPQHIVIETGLLLFIIWLLFIRRTVDPNQTKKNEKLSSKEVEWLIDTWKPEPLAEPLDQRSQQMLDSIVTIKSVDGNYFNVAGVQDRVLNLSTYDFIGSSQSPGIKEASEKALHKYGCGSCGPRGFYGTIDVHLELESAIASFLGTEEAIYYSDGASAVTSTIPAFSKRGDLIIMDEFCNDAIRTGVDLSRSTVVLFRHNDMVHLREILTSIANDDKRLKRDTLQQRRFIITEGLFQLVGDVCPLPDLLKLKEEFFYRLILDESLSFGTIGPTGKGVTEHYGIDIKAVEIITIALDASMASVGGLCVGSHEVVDHQRLSGAGYCFSASAPPFLAMAGLSSLKRLQDNASSLMKELHQRCDYVKNSLSQVKGFRLSISEDALPTPIIHMCLEATTPPRSWHEEEALVRELVRMCLHNGVGLTASKVSSERLATMNKQTLRPSARLCVSTSVSIKELDHALAVVTRSAEAVLQKKHVASKWQ